jgi:hypothetical protein
MDNTCPYTAILGKRAEELERCDSEDLSWGCFALSFGGFGGFGGFGRFLTAFPSRTPRFFRDMAHTKLTQLGLSWLSVISCISSLVDIALRMGGSSAGMLSCTFIIDLSTSRDSSVLSS